YEILGGSFNLCLVKCQEDSRVIFRNIEDQIIAFLLPVVLKSFTNVLHNWAKHFLLATFKFCLCVFLLALNGRLQVRVLIDFGLSGLLIERNRCWRVGGILELFDLSSERVVLINKSLNFLADRGKLFFESCIRSSIL